MVIMVQPKMPNNGRRITATALTALLTFALFAGMASAANATAQLGAPALSINGTYFRNGNTITLNAMAYGGAAPYTYNFTIENASTGRALLSSGPMLNSNTFSFNAAPGLNGGDVAVVQVTDSGSDQATAVSAGMQFIVNSTAKIISNPAVANSTANQTAALTPAPPASTNEIGAGIVVIILLAVIGAYLYRRDGKR